MVDYNIGIPQQQYFQAPDLMQNAMRMQQMQMHGAQMEELARKRQEETALRSITADPSSPEYIQQLARISPELGMKALNMQRQNTLLEQQTRGAGLSAAKTGQDIQSGHIDLIRKFNDEIPGILASNDPAASYANWRTRLKSLAPESNVPDVFPGEKALRGYADKAEAYLARTAPQRATIGGVETEYAPGTGAAREIGVAPFNPNAGVPSYPMRPAAAADMQRRAQLYAPDLVGGATPAQPNAMAPVNPAASPVAPVNAMAAPPSPYGALVGAGAFAQQQGSEASAREIEKQRQLEVMKRDVAANAPPAAMNAQQERAMLNTVSKDRMTAETTISTMDDVLKAVKDVQNLSEGQKSSITGLTSKLPNLSGEARTAQTKLTNLKGIVTQMGKRAASLGGAIGNMAVQEWKIVADGIASLDTSNMNAKDLNDQLDIIASKASAAAARTKDAYERQYEDLNVKHKGRFALSGNAATPAANAGAELSVDDLLKKYAK